MRTYFITILFILPIVFCCTAYPNGFKFVDQAEAAGLSSFQHVLGSTSKLNIFDTMGSGVCAADINDDGYDDLYFLNAGRLGEDSSLSKPKNRLYLNNQDGTFTDITESSGLGSTAWSMSAVFGDIDLDRDVDVYVGNFGRNQLFRNNGDNTFTEITDDASVGDTRFAVGTIMADINHDGWLDIFVTNYVEVSEEIIQSKGGTGKFRGLDVMLGPLSFEPQGDVLYLNNGDGTFTDITVQAGITKKGRGMGSVFCDFDNDGDQDLYIANDSTYNFLYENNSDGSFEEIGILTGAAVDRDGVEQGSMGAAVGNVNGDNWMDLFVTAFDLEHDVLYQNMRGLFFQDITQQMKMAQRSYRMVGWGNAIADFNNDGYDDIVVANGHIYPKIVELENNAGYAQKNSIFLNKNGKEFLDVTDESGPGFQIKKVSRGMAVSDFDCDGDLDIAINNLEDTPTLLINQSILGNWVQLDVRDHPLSMTGTAVTLITGEHIQRKEISAGSGYQSQNSQIMHFGLGDKSSGRFNIRFPGKTTRLMQLHPVSINKRMKVTPDYGKYGRSEQPNSN